MEFVVLTTERLLLRQWRDSDREPFAAMNADHQVMRFFEQPRTRAESDATAERLAAHIDRHGFGFWAAELQNTGQFIGFVGMENVTSDMPFAPAVEIGWRLDSQVWGQGLAPEGARACLAFAFARLGLDEVVSFTAASNVPSMRVMEKIGMVRDKGRDFDHPHVSETSPLKPHVFYRIGAGCPVFA